MSWRRPQPSINSELCSLLSKSKFSPPELEEIQTFTPEKIKIAVIGSGGIGKSALSLQYVQSLFSEGYDPTLQDYYSKKALIGDQYIDIEILDTAGQDEFSLLRNEYMKNQDGFLLCFSLSNKNSFDEIDKFYKEIYRAGLQPGEAATAMATTSATISATTSATSGADGSVRGARAPIFLIGTKCDIKKANWQVSENDISQKLHKLHLNLLNNPVHKTTTNNKTHGCSVVSQHSKTKSEVLYTDHRFLETSAKVAINVDAAFEGLAEEILQNKRLEFARNFKNLKRQIKKAERIRLVTCGVCKVS